jgi:mannose-1-phosphate guanylyltransferase
VERVTRHAVVMAGGSGTRFWPRSRRRVPKQLLTITGRRSLLADTLLRLRPLVPRRHTYIVTAASHAAAVRRETRGLPRGHVLVEPEGRNTAAAIALAALTVARTSPDGTMAVLPADHVVGDDGAFRATLAHAFAVAETTDRLVTIGVTPTYAETGYGYIQVGAPLGPAADGAHAVARFVEKPDAARATRLLARGDVLWNAGIFVWRVERILDELRRWLPELMAPLEAAVQRGTARALARAYRRAPAISIDTGVLERAEAVAVIRATFPWSDVGSWASVADLWRNGTDRNAVRGNAVVLESDGCVVDAGSRLVALVGARDLVVVDTPDALLVCPKSRAQDVRLVVDELRRRRLERYL